MLFGLVRVLFGLIGISGVLGLVLGVPVLLLDREWSKAISIGLGGILGLWMVRVAWYGTFTGEAPARDHSESVNDQGHR